MRNTLTATYGIECSQGAGNLEPPPDLSSGDSGSNSGSGVYASSGSPSGSLTWQWTFWGVILVSGLIGSCVGGCMFMQMKKKSRGKGKGGRGDAAPEEGEQMMQAMDDGAGDAVYQGDDGIPEPLQEQAPMVQEVPQAVETANFERFEVEPLLFGPVSNLLPGPTASTIVSAPQYQYNYSGAYPQAVPQAASNYTSGYYQAPMATNAGYYQATAPATTAVYEGGYAPQPAYATTAYAPQVAGTIV